MTAGHKHRTVHVRRNGLAQRVLQGTTLWRTDDLSAAERSRLIYSPDSRGGYRLSLLGFLHGLTGLTIDVDDE